VIPPVNAVPEPETYALILGGLAAVGAIARRRRAQR
jgi:PEP-CTERM motif